MNKSRPLISVIIPCFNQGKFIMDAIQSVQNQTYGNWEIVIVNDGSTDDFTVDLLQSLTLFKVKVIHTINQGLSTARNNGIAHADGELILPLDADDKIAPSYIDLALKEFQRNSALKLVYCQGRYFGERNDKIENNINPFNLKDLLLYNFIFCSAIFRKKDFEIVGGYSANMKGGWEDWDFWIRLLKNGGEVYQLPFELFFYRVQKISMIEDLKKNVFLQNDLGFIIYTNNKDIYLKEFGSPITILRHWHLLKLEEDNFIIFKEEIYSSMSYRLGHTLLRPLKSLKYLLKSWR
jgi:glycosyltransferase involved in cell wall biosynthesis